MCDFLSAIRFPSVRDVRRFSYRIVSLSWSVSTKYRGEESEWTVRMAIFVTIFSKLFMKNLCIIIKIFKNILSKSVQWCQRVFQWSPNDRFAFMYLSTQSILVSVCEWKHCLSVTYVLTLLHRLEWIGNNYSQSIQGKQIH